MSTCPPCILSPTHLHLSQNSLTRTYVRCPGLLNWHSNFESPQLYRPKGKHRRRNRYDTATLSYISSLLIRLHWFAVKPCIMCNNRLSHTHTGLNVTSSPHSTWLSVSHMCRPSLILAGPRSLTFLDLATRVQAYSRCMCYLPTFLLLAAHSVGVSPAFALYPVVLIAQDAWHIKS